MMNSVDRISLERQLQVPLRRARPSQGRATVGNDHDTDILDMNGAAELLLESATSGARNPILSLLHAPRVWMLGDAPLSRLGAEPGIKAPARRASQKVL